MTCAGAQVHQGRDGEGAAVHTHGQLVLPDDTEGAFLPVPYSSEPLNRNPKMPAVPRNLHGFVNSLAAV